jgi:prophage regulatory protein
MSPKTTPLPSFLRLPQVRQITGLPRSSIYAKVAAGAFPSPVALGARSVAWVDSEINDWVASRIAARASGGGR